MSWETRLSTLLEGLTLLQAIQRRWLYLKPIFGRGALPAVAGRFRHVDGEFKAIMMQLQVCCMWFREPLAGSGKLGSRCWTSRQEGVGTVPGCYLTVFALLHA